MLIDTHCHLDAPAFDADREAVVRRAAQVGVGAIVVPAVDPGNWQTVRSLAARSSKSGQAASTSDVPSVCYALGIHPCFLDGLSADAITQLHQSLTLAAQDPQLVAVGEIGLDNFINDADPVVQEALFVEQLKLAREFELPVIMHCRRSADRLLKHLRAWPVRGGIVHAFNGSVQQAGQFLDLGFALGFGGAMTFERARNIRRLARELPSDAHVLETDAPDIAPEWIDKQRNEPGELAQIATVFAQLRDCSVDEVIATTADNAKRVLPRLGSWLA